jgi:subfamily B ATP-binding cassette protein MsbA
MSLTRVCNLPILTIGVIAIVILYFIAVKSLGKDMTPGAFFVYLGIFFQMMPSLKLFGQVFNVIKEGSAAAERVDNVLGTQPKIFDSPNAVELKSFNDKIEFKDVNFKYEKVMDIKNINLTIHMVNTCYRWPRFGKSSLVDLIPRFYDPIDGSIQIDGVDIRNIKLKSLRDFMGIVAQETILFNDTIRNNIAYGSVNLPLKSIIEAASAANAHNFIDDLPNGYNTIIGDRGLKLSGGERHAYL